MMKSNISFGVELHDKRRIEDAAATAGLSVAEWCRVHLLAAIPDDDCPQEVCSGPGWYTITDSQVVIKGGCGKSLEFSLRPDGFLDPITFCFWKLEPGSEDERAFADFLIALDHPSIKNTGELHGLRVYLPRLWHNGTPARGYRFANDAIAYILNGGEPPYRWFEGNWPSHYPRLTVGG